MGLVPKWTACLLWLTLGVTSAQVYYQQQTYSVCSQQSCSRGKCVWGYNGQICSCNPGYQNPFGNTSVCVDVNECLYRPSVCEDGQCTNYMGSYECKCNHGYIPTSNKKRCTYDPNAPFTNTWGFHEFLTSMGYSNPQKYLIPEPVRRSKTQPPIKAVAPYSNYVSTGTTPAPIPNAVGPAGGYINEQPTYHAPYSEQQHHRGPSSFSSYTPQLVQQDSYPINAVGSPPLFNSNVQRNHVAQPTRTQQTYPSQSTPRQIGWATPPKSVDEIIKNTPLHWNVQASKVPTPTLSSGSYQQPNLPAIQQQPHTQSQQTAAAQQQGLYSYGQQQAYNYGGQQTQTNWHRQMPIINHPGYQQYPNTHPNSVLYNNNAASRYNSVNVYMAPSAQHGASQSLYYQTSNVPHQYKYTQNQYNNAANAYNQYNPNANTNHHSNVDQYLPNAVITTPAPQVTTEAILETTSNTNNAQSLQINFGVDLSNVPESETTTEPSKLVLSTSASAEVTEIITRAPTGTSKPALNTITTTTTRRPTTTSNNEAILIGMLKDLFKPVQGPPVYPTPPKNPSGYLPPFSVPSGAFNSIGFPGIPKAYIDQNKPTYESRQYLHPEQNSGAHTSSKNTIMLQQIQQRGNPESAPSYLHAPNNLHPALSQYQAPVPVVQQQPQAPSTHQQSKHLFNPQNIHRRRDQSARATNNVWYNQIPTHAGAIPRTTAIKIYPRTPTPSRAMGAWGLPSPITGQQTPTRDPLASDDMLMAFVMSSVLN